MFEIFLFLIIIYDTSTILLLQNNHFFYCKINMNIKRTSVLLYDYMIRFIYNTFLNINSSLGWLMLNTQKTGLLRMSSIRKIPVETSFWYITISTKARIYRVDHECAVCLFSVCLASRYLHLYLNFPLFFTVACSALPRKQANILNNFS